MKTRAVPVNLDPGNVGELSTGYQLTGLEIAQVIQHPNRERQTKQATWTAVNIPLMRTLRLRTGSLHACSIGKKTRQTEPAQQNNQILTLEGHDINNTVFLWWLSSLPSAEMKVDTIKLLQSWVVKKRKRTKSDKQTTTTTITHFGKVFFAIPGKERLRMKWPCY